MNIVFTQNYSEFWKLAHPMGNNLYFGYFCTQNMRMDAHDLPVACCFHANKRIKSPINLMKIGYRSFFFDTCVKYMDPKWTINLLLYQSRSLCIWFDLKTLPSNYSVQIKRKKVGFFLTKKTQPGGKSVIATSLLEHCFKPNRSPEVTRPLWSLDNEQT